MSRAPIPPIRLPGLLGPAVRPINRAITQVNEIASMSGVDIRVQRGPLGTSFINGTGKTRSSSFYGVLVDGGPPAASSSGANQPDFTDARYWVQALALSQTQAASMTDPVSASLDATFLMPDGSYGGGLWLVATNLNESMTGTHLLPTIPANSTASIPAGATIVMVTQQRAVKVTTLPNDFGNTVWTFEPVTNLPGSGTSSGTTIINNYSSNNGNSIHALTTYRTDNTAISTFPSASNSFGTYMDLSTLATTGDTVIRLRASGTYAMPDTASRFTVTVAIFDNGSKPLETRAGYGSSANPEMWLGSTAGNWKLDVEITLFSSWAKYNAAGDLTVEKYSGGATENEDITGSVISAGGLTLGSMNTLLRLFASSANNSYTPAGTLTLDSFTVEPLGVTAL